MGVKLPNYKEIALTAGGGTTNIDTSDYGNYYIVTGTATLTSSWTIQYNTSPPVAVATGMTVEVLWRATITLDGNNITFLGNTLTQRMVNTQGKFTFEYNGSSWDMYWQPDFEESIDVVETQTLVAGGETITLDPATNDKFQVVSGSATLTSSYTIQTGGTPQEGDEFRLLYKATMTLDGNNITIFGTALSATDALGGTFLFLAKYDGSAWHYAQLAVLSDELISNARLAHMGANTVKVRNANSTGDPSDVTVDDTELLIGNGEGFTTATLSGDVTMDNTGAVTIAAGAVEVSMVETDLKTEVIHFTVNFDTAATNRFRIPYPGSVVHVYGIAQTAIGGGANGVITFKNAAGTSLTSGTLTFTASDPVNTAYSATPSANNTFSADDILYAETSGSTTGTVLLSIEVLKS